MKLSIHVDRITVTALRAIDEAARTAVANHIRRVAARYLPLERGPLRGGTKR